MELNHFDINPDESWLSGLRNLQQISQLELPQKIARSIKPKDLSNKIITLEISGEGTLDLLSQGEFSHIQNLYCFDGYLRVSPQNFPNLKCLATNFDKTKKQNTNLSKFKNLTDLQLGKVKGSTLLNEFRLEKLNSLSLYSGSINDLSILNNFTSLTHVRLKNLTKIEDLSFLEHNQSIQKIDISYCPQLKNIDSLVKCSSLKSIRIGCCSKLIARANKD